MGEDGVEDGRPGENGGFCFMRATSLSPSEAEDGATAQTAGRGAAAARGRAPAVNAAVKATLVSFGSVHRSVCELLPSEARAAVRRKNQGDQGYQ